MVRSDGFAPRLSAYYAAYFIGVGIQLPFFPVWLDAKGLEPGLIGLVLALPMAVRIFAVPAVTGVADRRDALRLAIVLGSFATAIGYGLVGVLDDAAKIMAVYLLASLVFTSTVPLVDAYAMRGLTRRGKAYGPVRLWGSASFILGSFGAGALLHVVSAIDLIWLISGAYALTTVVAFTLAPIESGARRLEARGDAGLLLRNPVVVTAVIGASLVQGSHALFYGFGTIAWQARGLDSTTIGALWALGVIAEIVLFAVSGRLPRWVGPTMLLTLGGVGAVARWGLMAFDPPFAMLPFVQSLHALSFAATHLGAVGFINRAAPSGVAATAQGYLSIALGIAMALATVSSGLLFAALAHLAYGAMAAVAAIGLTLILYAHRHWPPAGAGAGG